MSASEIIEQIKALPREERQRVVEFVHTVEREQPAPEVRQIRFASDEAAKAAGDRAVAQFSEVFRRLAE